MEKVIAESNRIRDDYHCTYVPFTVTRENLVKIDEIRSFFYHETRPLNYDHCKEAEVKYLAIRGSITTCHSDLRDVRGLPECDMDILLSKIKELS